MTTPSITILSLKMFSITTLSITINNMGLPLGRLLDFLANITPGWK
jgi:hypothetical protein